MHLRIERIAFRNFRNYETFELSALGPLTVLVGPNAVGKTNVVEGVQLLTALQSFRRPSLEQIVRQGADFARLDADVTDGSRELALSLQVSEGKKRYLLNGKGKRTADLKGLVPSVTFAPDDLELAKGAPAVKRAALDALGSQLSANHYVIKKDYEKVVRYKNRLLKDDALPELVASIDETHFSVPPIRHCDTTEHRHDLPHVQRLLRRYRRRARGADDGLRAVVGTPRP